MNAAYFVPLLGITLMAIGVIGVGTAAWHSHRQNQRLDFIRSLGIDGDAQQLRRTDDDARQLCLIVVIQPQGQAEASPQRGAD